MMLSASNFHHFRLVTVIIHSVPWSVCEIGRLNRFIASGDDGSRVGVACVCNWILGSGWSICTRLTESCGTGCVLGALADQVVRF
jgi:hypothetical protein